MRGLKVGPPVDLRTGFDILTSDGRRKAWELIERLRPKVIHLAPVCGPWSQLQNINDQDMVRSKRARYLPMVEFCARVAAFQIQNGGFFIIENPSTSRIWYTRCFQAVLKKHGVTWNTLDMCAYGMRHPNGSYYHKPTSLLHNFPDGILDPVFKKCPNKWSNKHRTHQPVEGSAPGHGSRTKLAQIYPYRFCSAIIRSIFPLGQVRSLLTIQSSLLMDILESFSEKELEDLHSQMTQYDDIPEHTSYSVITDKTTSVPASDFFSKRALNKINSMVSHKMYTPEQAGMHDDVSHLRQKYLPTMAFDHAIIFRGDLQPLCAQYRQTSGVLLMWRKTDVSRLYVLQNLGLDLTQLIPQHWCCILYYNGDGRIPVDAQQPQPINVDPPNEQPPGLPPQHNQDQPPQPPPDAEMQNVFPDDPDAPMPFPPENPPDPPGSPHDYPPHHPDQSGSPMQLTPDSPELIPHDPPGPGQVQMLFL